MAFTQQDMNAAFHCIWSDCACPVCQATIQHRFRGAPTAICVRKHQLRVAPSCVGGSTGRHSSERREPELVITSAVIVCVRCRGRLSQHPGSGTRARPFACGAGHGATVTFTAGVRVAGRLGHTDPLWYTDSPRTYSSVCGPPSAQRRHRDRSESAGAGPVTAAHTRRVRPRPVGDGHVPPQG